MNDSLDCNSKGLDVSHQGNNEQENVSTERVKQLFYKKVVRERKRTNRRRYQTMTAVLCILVAVTINWNSIHTLASEVVSRIVWSHKDGTQDVKEIEDLNIPCPSNVEEGNHGYTKYYDSLKNLEQDLGINFLHSDLEWDKSFPEKIRLHFPKDPYKLMIISDLGYAVVGDYIENIKIGEGHSLLFENLENSRHPEIVNLYMTAMITTSDNQPGVMHESEQDIQDYSDEEIYINKYGIEAQLYSMGEENENARLIYNNVEYNFSGSVTREVMKEIINSLHE